MKAVMVLGGKGGVGKTLVAVNIALHLKDKGVKVGLLDADFSASNTGYFLDVKNKAVAMKGERFEPAMFEDDLEVFSIPLMMGERAISMEGDQYSQLLRDAVNCTNWKAEYLVLDCPAGWGDEWKAAARIFSESLLGSVIVLQPAHELDARRALRLHKDLGLPILGLIENMSWLKVGKAKWKIFGESIVDTLAEEFEAPVFGKIPLSMQIRKQVEMKNPKLTEDNAQPIINACEAILNAKPVKPGFLAKLKNWMTIQFAKLLFELMVSVNQELDIPAIQQQYGYPGGTIIRLNILNEQMDANNPIHRSDWIITKGTLTVAEGHYTIDSQIDITPKALKWALLGNRMLSNGYMYSFSDAHRLGQMKLYGDRSMVRGAYFMQHVFIALSRNEKAMQRINPFLEIL